MSICIFITHDENSLSASLHSTHEEALEELRRCLNNTPVDYQDPLPSDATKDEIEDAADDRSQFAWEILEAEVPVRR